MQWQRRLLLYALSLAGVVLGVVCAGVSFLLFSALPVLNEQSAWMLVMLPVVLLAVSAFLYLVARQSKVEPLFQDIQEQIALDILSLRKVSAK